VPALQKVSDLPPGSPDVDGRPGGFGLDGEFGDSLAYFLGDPNMARFAFAGGKLERGLAKRSVIAVCMSAKKRF
jgi:hypothetical protein